MRSCASCSREKGERGHSDSSRKPTAPTPAAVSPPPGPLTDVRGSGADAGAEPLPKSPIRNPQSAIANPHPVPTSPRESPSCLRASSLRGFVAPWLRGYSRQSRAEPTNFHQPLRAFAPPPSVASWLRGFVANTANLAQQPPPTNTDLTRAASARILKVLTQCPGPP